MFNEETKSILLYFCTKTPVSNNYPTLFIGGEEIRFDVIQHYKDLAKKMEIDLQVILFVPNLSQKMNSDMRRYRKNVNVGVRFQENSTPTLTKTMTYKVI